MPLLEAEDLRIHIRSEDGLARAVDGVSFSLEPGEALALVGESGCGKSLTALGIMGLLPSAAFYAGGTLRFQGNDILGLSENNRRKLRGREMAMVFQDPMQFLNPVLTCGEQVAESLLILEKKSSREAQQRVQGFLLLLLPPACPSACAFRSGVEIIYPAKSKKPWAR